MPVPSWVGAPVYAGATSGTSLALSTPAGIAAGDLLVAAIRAQGTVSGTTPITLPADWVRAGGPNGAADRAQGIFYLVVTDPATVAPSHTFGGWGSGRSVGSMRALRGVDLADPVAGGAAYSPTNLDSYSADGAPFLATAMWGDERTSPRSHVPSAPPAGYGVVDSVQSSLDSSTTGSRTALWWGDLAVPAGGSLTVPAAELVWSDGASANRAVSAAFRGSSAASPIGLPVKDGAGATAYLSYLDGAGARKAPASVRLTLPPFEAADMLATPGVTMGHRGASGVVGQPEMSRRGYRYAATERGYRMLEFSANTTSDGVFVGCHDASINRTSQTTGLPNLAAMTWADVQAYQNTLRSAGLSAPYYRLEDFLDEFGSEATVHVDPKYNISGITSFLNVLDAHGGPDRIVVKYVGSGAGGTAIADSSRARGYMTAGYYYEANWSAGQLDAEQSHWDILGMSYDASSPVWSRTTEGAYPGIRSYGKPVLAHIIPNQAAYAVAQAAISEGGWLDTPGHSWIAQVSGVGVVAPVS